MRRRSGDRLFRAGPWIIGGLGLIALVFWALSFAHAEDVTPPTEVILSIEDYAVLVGAAGQVKPLKAEVEKLDASLANMTEQRDGFRDLAELRAQIAAGYKELAGIEAAKYVATKERLATVEKLKARAGFLATVEKRMYQGALGGTVAGTALPGVGNVVGGLAGGVIGAITGAIESLVQGP